VKYQLIVFVQVKYIIPKIYRVGVRMINFTVGPVHSSDAIRAIGGEQIPYFRTAEFSTVMLENERLVLEFSLVRPSGRELYS